jgi:hypothetical protein
MHEANTEHWIEYTYNMQGITEVLEENMLMQNFITTNPTWNATESTPLK